MRSRGWEPKGCWRNGTADPMMLFAECWFLLRRFRCLQVLSKEEQVNQQAQQLVERDKHLGAKQQLVMRQEQGLRAQEEAMQRQRAALQADQEVISQQVNYIHRYESH